jgi:ubiquinone biosynthesis protein UbiJ
LVRQTIMDTQEDVEMLLEKFDKLEERLYELSKDK